MNTDVRPYADADHRLKKPEPKGSGFLARVRQDTIPGQAYRHYKLGTPSTGNNALIGVKNPLEFNPFENLEPKYRPYAENFRGVYDELTASEVKAHIDAELSDRAISQKVGGIGGFGMDVAAQAFDPVNYLPFAGPAARGASLGTRVGKGAVNAGAGGVVQELALGGQQTRTIGESASNVAASVAFGSLFGAAGYVFTPKQRQNIMSGVMSEIEGNPEPVGGSLSAAMAPQIEMPDLEITSASQRAIVAATTKSGLGFLAPHMQMQNSQSVTAKSIGSELMENFLQIQGSDEGKVGIAAETTIKRKAKAMEAVFTRDMGESFQAYITETGGPSKWRIIGRSVAEREFGERVGRALRRGDIDPDSEAVSAAARALREKVFEPMRLAGIEAGIFPPEMQGSKTALSYFTRSYNQGVLSAKQTKFVDIVSGWILEQHRRGLISDLDLKRQEYSAANNELAAASQDNGFISQVELDDLAADLRRMEKVSSGIAKFPVMRALQGMGGIDPKSTIADELRAMGVTPRTNPGIYRMGGLRDIDNLDYLSEDLNGVILMDGNYFDRADLIEAIREEVAGSPRRSEAQTRALDDADTVRDFLDQTVGDGVSRKEYDRLVKQVGGLKSRLNDAEAAASEAGGIDAGFYARQAAQEVYDTLTGRNQQSTENPFAALLRGSANERTFMIPDELIEEFLDDNAFDVVSHYIRSMNAEIELKKKFGRADMRDQIAKVNDDYSALKEGVTEKEAIALDKERDLMIKNIEASRDTLRGTYLTQANSGAIAALARAIANFNFVTKLGDVFRTSIPDSARIAMVHGMENFLGEEGREILAESIKAMRGSEAENFLKQEAELAGIAEVLLNSRVMAMAEMMDPYSQRGPVETFTRSLANIGAKLSGINHWNQFIKQVAFQHGVHRFKRISEVGFDNASKVDREWLRSLKVSRFQMNAITEQMKAHSGVEGKLVNPKTESWTHREAVDAFRDALSADVDSVVVTSGIADKPFIARHPLGALAFQFKSFAAASHSRALTRGLGQNQASFMTGATAQITLGMAVYYLKSLSDPEFELSDNPGTWIAEGIDRAGVIPLVMEANNMIEPMLHRAGAGGVYTGLNMAFGGDGNESSSRYRFRTTPDELLLGPTAGTIRDARRVVEDVLTPDGIREGTVGAASRLIPFANHPGIKEFMRYWAVPELKDAVR